jgi:hypothetical protein
MDKILEDKQAQDIISSIISAEDIIKFVELENKIKKAEILLAEKEYEVNKQLYESRVITDSETPLPYTVKINVTTEVIQGVNDKYKEPIKIEQISNDYLIDFSIQNYRPFIEEFYNSIQSVLEETCSKVFKQENTDGDI